MYQRGNLPSIKFQAAGGIALRAGAAALGFVANSLIAASLGPASFGAYATVLAVVTILATISTMGWPAYLTREVAQNGEVPDSAQGKDLLLAASVSSTLVAGLMAAGLVLFALYVADKGSSLHSVTGLALVAMAASIPLQTFSQLRAGILRGMHQALRADLPELLIKPLIILIFVLFAAFGAMSRTVDAFFLIQFLGCLGAAIIGFMLIAKNWREPVRVSWSGRWCAPAASFWLIGPVGMLLSQVPLYLLVGFSTETEAGRFALAMQLASPLTLAIMATEVAIQSRLALAYAHRDYQGMEAIARGVAKASLAISSLAGVVMVFVSFPFLRFLGEGWIDAYPVVGVLIAGNLAYAGMGPCRVVLSMTGGERTVLMGVICGCLISAGVGLVLVFTLGATGAAIGATTATATVNLLFFLTLKRRLGITTSPLLSTRWRSS